jgi:hypothetical protein
MLSHRPDPRLYSYMPIDIPCGSFQNARLKAWLVGKPGNRDRYLILPTAVAVRVERLAPRHYWRFMSSQLERIGLRFDPRDSWRAFAD